MIIVGIGSEDVVVQWLWIIRAGPFRAYQHISDQCGRSIPQAKQFL